MRRTSTVARFARRARSSVFALHLVGALALLTAAVTWMGTAWKLAWGTADAAPDRLPSLPWLLFLPAAVAGVCYAAMAARRVYGDRWWLAIVRTLLIAGVGAAAVSWVVTHMG